MCDTVETEECYTKYEEECETVYKERCSTEYELECTTGIIFAIMSPPPALLLNVQRILFVKTFLLAAASCQAHL